MRKLRKNRTFAERLYKLNKIAGANQARVDMVDVIQKKIEDPPFEDDENQEKGTI